MGKYVGYRTSDSVDVLEAVFVRPVGLVCGEYEAPACFQAPKVLADVGVGYHGHRFARPMGGGPGDEPDFVPKLLDKIECVHREGGKKYEGGTGVPFGSRGVEKMVIVDSKARAGSSWGCVGGSAGDERRRGNLG